MRSPLILSLASSRFQFPKEDVFAQQQFFPFAPSAD
jgi:hypothetical protein